MRREGYLYRRTCCSLFVLTCCLLSGCQRHTLTCRTDYLHPSYLASVQVNTPDTHGGYFYGQQIVVSWHLPRRCVAQPLVVQLQVRYGTREIETHTLPIYTPQGTWVYRLVNVDYWRKKGILAFQAQILRGDRVVSEWNHSLWAHIIHIPCEEIDLSSAGE